MPLNPLSPGVYIQEMQELPSSTRSVNPASTSTTAFLDFFPRGPLDGTFPLTSFVDFEQRYGGLHPQSEASYQISQFFLNGGTHAFAVRLAPASAATASLVLPSTPSGMPGRVTVSALNPGSWGNLISVAIQLSPGTPAHGQPTFSLQVQEHDPSGQVVQVETYLGLSFATADPQYFLHALGASALITLADDPEQPLPALPPPNPNWPASYFHPLSGGADGTWDQPSAEYNQALLAALDPATSPLNRLLNDRFSLLAIPGVANLPAEQSTPIHAAALALCAERRAFYLADIPASLTSPADMLAWFAANQSVLNQSCGAVFYPRLTLPDPGNPLAPRSIGNSGSIAGVYAASDAARGVWRTPAGTAAAITGATPAFPVTDADNQLLTPRGINAIRTFPALGTLIWGGRTFTGSDLTADQYKYIAVRRLTDFIENSLSQSLAWVVFEPNNETLWSNLRVDVTTFLQQLFQQGAFQGSTPAAGYFVQCDVSTTPQSEVDRGFVNLVVGFAPLKPAEFIILQLGEAVAS